MRNSNRLMTVSQPAFDYSFHERDRAPSLNDGLGNDVGEQKPGGMSKVRSRFLVSLVGILENGKIAMKPKPGTVVNVNFQRLNPPYATRASCHDDDGLAERHFGIPERPAIVLRQYSSVGR